MYEGFYGFKERPFALLPDPDFLYLGESHQAALNLLELAVVNQTGFCVLSGEIGAGKTTLVRELLNRLDPSIKVGLVFNTHSSFGELMQWIMAAYGLPCRTSDRVELHKQFLDFVIQNYANGQTTLLIIDEAQNLSVMAMEELRMLSNVNSDKNLVLQVILVGQQQLRDKLREPRLEQFAQRIGVDFHLCGLSARETSQYINHRLGHAGAVSRLFSDAACEAVYHFSHGIPRLINRICDLSLVYGYAGKNHQISAELVQAVVKDQQMSGILEAAAAQPAPTRRFASQPFAQERDARTVRVDGRRSGFEQPVPIAPPDHAVRADIRPHRGRPQTLDASPPVTACAARVEQALEHSTTAPELAPACAVVPQAPPAARHSGEEQAVDAGLQPTHASGVRGVAWLWLGLFIMLGATAWSSHELWYPLLEEQMGSVSGLHPEWVPLAGVVEPTTMEQRLPASRRADGNPPPSGSEALPRKHSAQPIPARTAAELTTLEGRPRSQPALSADEVSAGATGAGAGETPRQLAQEVQLRREQQRVANLKEEVQRLERERLVAERTLAQQREVRQALEQKVLQKKRALSDAGRQSEGSDEQRRGAAQQPLPATPIPVSQKPVVRESRPNAPDTDDGPAMRIQGFFLVPVQEAADNTGNGTNATPSVAP